ncbi:uncharacterized protein LOC144708266 [Wolffia australiana]
MPWSFSSLGSRIRLWLRDYDRMQSAAVVLLYIQIGCSLVGSLGALYNGVLLSNLAVALFALVAIENNSQSLGRTYAALLALAILVDIIWFCLFSHEIWNISSSKENLSRAVIFSVRLTLCMQIISIFARWCSGFLWVQMYRLGVSLVDSSAYREADSDSKNSFLNPPVLEPCRQLSIADDFLGGSIYDPAYYSSLFEDGQEKKCPKEDGRLINLLKSGSSSASDMESSPSRRLQVSSERTSHSSKF